MPAAGVFTTNLACAAPVQISREHLAERARGGGRAVVRATRTRRRGSAGRTDARRMAALTGEGLGVARRGRAGVLHRPHRLRAADGAARVGHPRAVRGSQRRRPRRPTPSSPPTPCARRRSAEVLGTAGLVGGMAKGAAMLSPAMATMLAVVTTDVVIDPTTLAGVPAGRDERHVRRAARRRVDEHQRHRARAGERAVRRRRRSSTASRSPTRSPRCAARWPSRWHGTPRARRSWCGCT